MPLIRRALVLPAVLAAVLAGGCAEEHSADATGHLSEAVNVYVVPATGGTARIVTAEIGDAAADDEADDHEEEEGRSESGSFSPDGDRLAFTASACESCSPQLLTTTTDGRRVDHPAGEVEAFQPTWGPPGIAYLRLDDRGNAIWLSSPDGGQVRRILHSRRSLAGPSWSADGRTLLVARQDTATNWDIYALSYPRMRLRRLTRSAAQELGPVMANDGTLAFARQGRDGRWSVHLKAPGSAARALPDQVHDTLEPAFSPDGSRVAFVRRHGDHASEIAVLDRDSGEVDALTGPRLYTTGPRFSPDGRSIVFTGREIEGGAEAPHEHAEATATRPSRPDQPASA